MINFEEYELLYDAEAFFVLSDKYGKDLFRLLSANSMEGWRALREALALMSVRGAARARREGRDVPPTLTEEYVADELPMNQVKEARAFALMTILHGCGKSDEDIERDLVLEEIEDEKKTDGD